MVFSFLFLMILPAQAQIPSPIKPDLAGEILSGGQQAASIALHIPVDVLAAADARIYAAGLVRIALSFIGILFIALMAYGGALWFLSQGNDETIKKAKGVLTRGVVGLAIVLSSYGVATLIQWGLVKATTEEVLWKAQDPNLISDCGTLWADYQTCSTTVDCSESQAKKIYKQWATCSKKSASGTGLELPVWDMPKGEWDKAQ